MYRSEQKFSEAFLRMLEKKVPMIQRIETGKTGRGVPDIYLRYPEYEQWIELKNSPHQELKQGIYKIDYRSGQQTWHYNYFRTCGRHVLTIMAVKDGFIVYPLEKINKGGLVDHYKCYKCTELRDLWTVLRGQQ